MYFLSLVSCIVSRYSQQYWSQFTGVVYLDYLDKIIQNGGFLEEFKEINQRQKIVLY